MYLWIALSNAGRDPTLKETIMTPPGYHMPTFYPQSHLTSLGILQVVTLSSGPSTGLEVKFNPPNLEH